ncbi:Fatty acyl-CoA reductase [Mycobacteroides salmoniphilum]|uniref:Fatty acyl-CoA reductase n=2 Tax=Mycobacteroides salmoniphilum TaxID=404941 RepID=A0A4R8SRF0_9MYCO|nr:Fatty acyl-CoA reductase [Mycobacteroides salmoniphilum]TEA02326.1 Fatty acyl-CoA reductase [Mycobacteroides salmoniphilum]
MNPMQRLSSLASHQFGKVNKALTMPTGQLTPHAIAKLVTPSRSLRSSVRNKIVMITGGSSGIGQAAALQIGEAGGTVLLVARSEDKLQETAAQVRDVGGTAHVFPCDLSDMDAIDRMVKDVLADHGRVDILINNAGRSIRRSLALSYDRPHDFERTMQLNYFAPLHLILGFMPGMRERKFGHIINISSIGVQTKVPRFGAYIASKAALDTVSDAFQAETSDEGLRFTTIHMPLVRTPMIAPTTLYQKFPALTPDEAGEVIAKAIIERPRRVASAFGRIASFADSLTPEIMDAVRNQGYKMFPDSDAAKGVKNLKPEEVDGGQQIFIDATPGVHW